MLSWHTQGRLYLALNSNNGATCLSTVVSYLQSHFLRYNRPLFTLPHEVPEFAASAENDKYDNFLSLGAVIPLSSESV
jgi:hypothetical protein